jgi:NADH-quinone oxidoreductase subunit L
MVVPLVVLALLSVCGGLVLHQALPAYLMSWGPGHLGEAESIPVAIFHSWPGILGVSAAFLVYTQFTWLPERCYFATRPVSTLLRGKYYIDEIYQVLIVQPLEHGAKVLWRVLDQGVIDGTVNGSAAVVDTCGEVVRWWQTGRVGQYALFMFVGLVLILACCFLG